MKKLFTLLSLFVLIGMSANVFAQTDTGTEPEIGSVHDYTVASHTGSTYTWSVTTDASGDTPVGAGVVTITNGNTNQASIQWDNPTVDQVYYVHVVELSVTTNCQNRKALAVTPVNAFALEIVNVDASDATQNEDYAQCPSDVTVVSYDGTFDGSLAESQDFSYDYGDALVAYYKITASGINTATTGWSPQFTISTTNTTGATVEAFWATSVNGTYTTTSLAVDGATNDIDVGSGNESIWIKVTVDHVDTSSGTEGLSAQDLTVALLSTEDSSEDENGNDVTDTGNGSRNQIISARPDTGSISTDN